MRDFRRYFTKHRSGSVLILLLAISLVLMWMTADSKVMAPKEVGNAVVSVVQRGAAGVADFFKRVFTSIREVARLRKRYAELEDELLRYRRDERELIQLRQENSQLRELLDLAEGMTYSHIAAEVIAGDPSPYYNSIVVNRGRAHGIRVDMPVVAFDDGFQGLVGKVASVGPVSSQILPLFDSRCFVAARLQKSRHTGLVQGTGDRFSYLEMLYVPKSARDLISVGDLVTTSGLSSLYPKDILIGRIRDITAESWETSLTLEIEPLVDFSRLEYVYIVDAGDVGDSAPNEEDAQ